MTGMKQKVKKLRCLNVSVIDLVLVITSVTQGKNSDLPCDRTARVMVMVSKVSRTAVPGRAHTWHCLVDLDVTISWVPNVKKKNILELKMEQLVAFTQ